jgi:hypothetical protein
MTGRGLIHIIKERGGERGWSQIQRQKYSKLFLVLWVKQKAVLWNQINLIWFRIRIRIQHFMLIRIRIWNQGFDDQKKVKKKNTAEICFISEIAIYLSLGLHKGRPSYRRNLQPSKENI